MAVIMREAIKPNLLQTLENTPVIVHAGPFGNIAHGNSSIVGDMIGIHTGDFLLTEAGFGADMGAERFFDIKCRASGLTPDAAVLVATVRALKVHSGHHKVAAGRPLPPAILEENPEEVLLGGANLRKQIENIQTFGVSPVVAINAFPQDFPSEHQAIREIAASMGVRAAVCTNFADGGKGATELAQAVVEAAEEPTNFSFLYPNEASLRQKIEALATKIYGADGVDYLPAASRQIDNYEKIGFGTMPVIIAKTHLSLSSDPTLKGAPTGWRMPVREARAVGRCRLRVPHLRRHEHHAGTARRTRPPRSSTSTRTARLSGSADEPPYLELSLAEFLGLVSAADPAPGGGSVAAVAVGLAAGLCVMAARLSTPMLPDAQGLADTAEALREHALALGQADAASFGAVVSAWRLPREPDPEERLHRIATALSGAAEVPAALTETAAAVAGLAARIAEGGNPNLLGDAVTAALLAEAGARAAAALVEINLKGSPDDTRRARAALAAGQASASARRAERANSA